MTGVNEELDRRLPRVDPTEPIPRAKPAPAAKAGGRVRRIALVVVAIVLAVVSTVAAAYLLGCVPTRPAARADEAKDVSTAGANAATRYDVEWAAGIHSVTVEDLGREYELGCAYPLNGKEAFLDSDTTYSKGAGMVDVVTFDRVTNVEIRHYGQLQEDGTVRWYAAETVLDARGMPVRMESE